MQIIHYLLRFIQFWQNTRLQHNQNYVYTSNSHLSYFNLHFLKSNIQHRYTTIKNTNLVCLVLLTLIC